MRILIFVITLLFYTSSFSQSLVGKWKPLSFSLDDSLFRGDVKADTFFINTTALRGNLKNDKDPKASEQMMRFVFQMLFDSMKELEEEYSKDGTYKETNSRTGKIKTGTYALDQQNKTLIKNLPNKQSFAITWKNDHLVLTTELESSLGKKGMVEIVYQKIN